MVNGEEDDDPSYRSQTGHSLTQQLIVTAVKSPRGQPGGQGPMVSIRHPQLCAFVDRVQLRRPG